ncbi:hypothetical protein ABFP25_15045 [Acinetobacter indicus]|uniref:hypothetical protein n=1 Tax=Acinetobacter indicus TaxID=756892 RepID=UPI0032138E12
MKYLLIGALVIVLGAFYFMDKSNKADAERLKQAEIAHQMKLEQQKAEEIEAQNIKSKKIEVDSKISDLQAKYSMDYLDAKQIVESKKMPQEDKVFYANLSGKWVDALNVAGSTSRVSLSQPVKDMQEIRRQLRDKTTGTHCESRMKQELLKSYDFAIDGFLNFMRQNEIASTAFIALSKDYQKNANALLDYC